MKRPTTNSFSSQAFSLAEMVVVIAIIAIIASFAIPNISAITASSHFAKNERNAQNIVSMALAAKAAGASTATWTNVNSLVDKLEAGIPVAPVPGAEPIVFQLSALSATEREGLTECLSVSPTGEVHYIAAQ